MHDHNGDRMLHNLLNQIGADMKKRREINFFLNFPNESQANHAHSELMAKKIKSSVTKNDAPWWKRLFTKPTWSLMAANQMALELPELMKLTTYFQQLATKHTGDYDGWEANVMGDQLDMSKMEN